MKQDARSGRYLIIEPNIGRPTGRSATAEISGVELLYTMYCDAIGWPLPANLEQTYHGAKWIYLRHDLQSAFYRWRKGELTLKEWRRSWHGLKTDAVFSWRDPLPFLCDMNHVVKVLLSDKERRKKCFATT
jgi:predicted ATP-grasp superfamily ATP-dependent carboligase